MATSSLNIEPLLLSKSDAAAHLGISARSIGYLLARNELKSTRLGGRVLIAMSEIKRIARNGVKSPLVER